MRWLLVVVLCVLGVRIVAITWLVPRWEATHGYAAFADHYPKLARHLLDEGTLRYSRQAEPTTVRGPGFGVWLAAGMSVSRNTTWIRAWASVPGVLSSALVFWLLYPRVGRALAMVGGMLCGVHPIAIVSSARAMSDEFVAACCLLAVVLLVSPMNRRTGDLEHLPYMVGAGACLGLAMLARSTAIAAAVSGLLLLVPLGRAGRLPAARWWFVLGALAIGLAAPALWSVRSSRLEGRPVFVHSLAFYNLWIGMAHDELGVGVTWSETMARERKVFARLAPDIMGAEGMRSYAELSPREAADLEGRLARAAWQDVRERPLWHLGRMARGVLRFWVQAQTRARTAQYAAVQGVLLVAALLGLAVQFHGGGRGARDRLVIVLAGWLVLTNLIYAAVLPMARMSVQVLPATAFFAAIGLGVLFGRAGCRLPPQVHPAARSRP